MPTRIIDLDTITSVASGDYLVVTDNSDGYLTKKMQVSQLPSQYFPGFQNTVILTSGTSWTPPSGVTSGLVTLLGAGGGGGGAGNLDSRSNGGGGNAGEFVAGIYTFGALPVTYAIGTGGTGGVGFATGTSGGNTIFGSLQANGGSGGNSAIVGDSGTAPGIENLKNYFTPGVVFNVMTYLAAQGGNSGYWDTGLVVGAGGAGGQSMFGAGGGSKLTSGNGFDATGYGSGGGGALDGTSDKTGGAGANGLIMIRY